MTRPRPRPPAGAQPDTGASAPEAYLVTPIGFVRSSLQNLEDAPRQGDEGAPEAFIEIDASVRAGLDGVSPGTQLVVLTWLHEARRDVLRTHPRGDRSQPLTGVFATRSPSRPNPVGLHRVTVLAVDAHGIRVWPLEAIDGTPVVDLKVALASSMDH